MMKLEKIRFPAVLGLTLMSSMAFAGPYNGIHPLQSDRFALSVGGFAADVSGRYQFDGGSDIDTDNTGLDSTETIPAFSAVWRLSNNTRVQGEYFKVTNSAKRSINESIVFPPLDLEFEVDATLKAELSIEVARAFFGYSFIKNDRLELGGGLGLHYMKLDTFLAGKASIDGGPGVNKKIGKDVSAILPNVGGYVNYAFSPRWIIGGRVDWISANIDKYDGGLWNVEGSIQFQVTDNFGVGASYRYLAVDLAIDDGNNSWAMDLAYEGPALFVTASF